MSFNIKDLILYRALSKGTGGGSNGGSEGNTPSVDTDETKPIRLYDYDGTLLYSYTHSQIASMTELPSAPSHEGLTFQGWNWTLSDLQNLSTEMNVGAMYTTDDGATRLHIVIDDILINEIPLYFYQTQVDGVTVDWGDGSATQTVTATGNVSISHVYSAVGEYTISLLPKSSVSMRLGYPSSTYFVFGPAEDGTRVIANILRGVNIGQRCTALNSYTFQHCRSLEYITVPSTVTSLGSYTFDHCGKLEAIVIPSSVSSVSAYTFSYCYGMKIVSIPLRVTSLDASCFRYCYSLESVTIPTNLTTLSGYVFSECYVLGKIVLPDKVKTIGNYAFNKCYSLSEVRLPEALTSIGSNVFFQNYALPAVDIPETVTSIGTYAFYECTALKRMTVPEGVTEINSATFYNCYGMKAYYINSATPPTLQTTAFNNIPDDCMIYIPQGSYDTYAANAEWSAYADRFIEME